MTSTTPPAEQPQIDLAALVAKQQDLTDAFTQVQAVTAETKDMLAQIAAYGERLNDPALVQLADGINERATWLRKLAKRGDAVAAGAVAALKETMGTRDALAGELQSLMQAIKTRERNDPRLKKFVDYMEENIADSLSWMGESQQEMMARNLMEELGLDSATAEMAAGEIQQLFSGDFAWTPNQREAVLGLIVALQENHGWMFDQDEDDEEYDE